MNQRRDLREATSVYDSYVEALETEAFEALQAYARNLSERIIPRGVETHEVVGIVLLLRDVLARSLFAKYQNDFKKLNRILTPYEPAGKPHRKHGGRRFSCKSGNALSPAAGSNPGTLTPVLQVRERLLILPNHRGH